MLARLRATAAFGIALAVLSAGVAQAVEVRVTTFSAGIPTNAKEREAARGLIAFVVSAEARPKLVTSGLSPIVKP